MTAPLYRPFRTLSPDIKASLDEGSTFEADGAEYIHWRTSTDGEPWYRRIDAAVVDVPEVAPTSNYLRGSELSDEELRQWVEAGSVEREDGEVVQFWKFDPDGVPWFRRSGDALFAEDSLPEIHADGAMFSYDELLGEVESDEQE